MRITESPVRDRALYGILAGNALTMVVAVVFEWGLVEALWPFWIQNLTTLAPDIMAAILDDALPNHITLFDLAVDLPALWDEQREGVGL